MTLGSKGCLIKSTGETIPAVKCGTVVDTTGAGDTFNGALCAMLADGHSIQESAKIANSIAAIGVTRRHAVSSIPPTDYEISRNIAPKSQAKIKQKSRIYAAFKAFWQVIFARKSMNFDVTKTRFCSVFMRLFVGIHKKDRILAA